MIVGQCSNYTHTRLISKWGRSPSPLIQLSVCLYQPCVVHWYWHTVSRCNYSCCGRLINVFYKLYTRFPLSIDLFFISLFLILFFSLLHVSLSVGSHWKWHRFTRLTISNSDLTDKSRRTDCSTVWMAETRFLAYFVSKQMFHQQIQSVTYSHRLDDKCVHLWHGLNMTT